MGYPLEATHWDTWSYKPEWFETDFFYSPDGIKEFPDHHCEYSPWNCGTYFLNSP